jgi:hypothetical protein
MTGCKCQVRRAQKLTPAAHTPPPRLSTRQGKRMNPFAEFEGCGSEIAHRPVTRWPDDPTQWGTPDCERKMTKKGQGPNVGREKRCGTFTFTPAARTPPPRLSARRGKRMNPFAKFDCCGPEIAHRPVTRWPDDPTRWGRPDGERKMTKKGGQGPNVGREKRCGMFTFIQAARPPHLGYRQGRVNG